MRFLSTTSELFDSQLTFKTLTISINGSNDQKMVFNQISNKFGLVENLRILSFPDPGFRPVFTSWPQKIEIMSSVWFNLEYLLTCTCSRITLENSPLENKDLDKLLKNWKVGGFQNLDRLKIYSRNITSTGTKILGINWRELNGMVIQTDDGTSKATIKNNVQRFKIHVTSFE
ncbi:hypothetical protein GCK72_003145 [Caenorhabditis remanei]|uniref:Sdz-33 F-box domain-containing protein n=1 Tax=Caenorhabditis remanei TaxID=31234 RepID=A0A6A5HU97_CAERE|nr:hypothetical protein GCK72_003145 [Caenorhabditis remanei]KAF1771319.1 hypothetical protein GCK72_003145 [Caenorhabditis remanei]